MPCTRVCVCECPPGGITLLGSVAILNMVLWPTVVTELWDKPGLWCGPPAWSPCPVSHRSAASPGPAGSSSCWQPPMLAAQMPGHSAWLPRLRCLRPRAPTEDAAALPWRLTYVLSCGLSDLLALPSGYSTAQASCPYVPPSTAPQNRLWRPSVFPGCPSPRTRVSPLTLPGKLGQPSVMNWVLTKHLLNSRNCAE